MVCHVLLSLWFALPAPAADTGSKFRLPSSSADLGRGEKLYQNNCALCHGTNGSGGRGPALTARRLSRAGDDTALVRVIREGIRGTEMPAADHMSEGEVRQVAAFVRSMGKVPLRPVPGDPARGAAIYRGKGGCTACHAIQGAGGISGPDLTAIGARRSPEYLHKSLTEPQAELPDSYRLLSVSPRQGNKVTGVRLNEDSFSLQLRDASGSLHSFWKADLDAIERHKGQSPMPSYAATLSAAERDDLVAYLVSLQEGS